MEPDGLDVGGDPDGFEVATVDAAVVVAVGDTGEGRDVVVSSGSGELQAVEPGCFQVAATKVDVQVNEPAGATDAGVVALFGL